MPEAVKNSSGATLSKFDYGYDVLGRITTWTNGLTSEAMVFNYDREDQLLDARRFPASGGSSPLPQAFSYGYDSAGNRIFEQTEIAPTPSGHPQQGITKVSQSTANNLNQLLSRSGAGSP